MPNNLHVLEREYSLTADELLTAIERRFRLKVALEGAVAEVHLWNELQALRERGIIYACEQFDADDKHDFEVRQTAHGSILKIECKTIRNDCYRSKGDVTDYKVETQKTRNSLDTGGETTRLYDVARFDILAVSMGRQTHNWREFLFVKTEHLKRHAEKTHKLAPLQRVPLPTRSDIEPWYRDLGSLLREEQD